MSTHDVVMALQLLGGTFPKSTSHERASWFQTPAEFQPFNRKSSHNIPETDPIDHIRYPTKLV